MLHSWYYLFDIIFPPTPDCLRLRHHTPTTILEHYRPMKIGDTWALSQYLDPTIKAAVTECKYQHNQQAAILLATLLRAWLTTQRTVPTLLLPVPLSAKRERKRGYNQVEQVCRLVADLPHITVAPNLLYRVRDTTPQTTLARGKRLSNMQDAFTVSAKHLPKLSEFEQIIICDDVTTTGATLTAATEALTLHLPANCRLTTVSWAH